MCVCVCALICSVVFGSFQPMDYSLSGSSVLGSVQARILEWAAISYSSSVQFSH